MRRQRSDDFSAISADIGSLRSDTDRIDQKLCELRNHLGEALGKVSRDFSEQDVLVLRKEIRNLEERRELVVNRTSALEDRLPRTCPESGGKRKMA